MRKRIEIATEPAKEPVSIDDVKNFAKIDTSSDDGLIDGMIIAARQKVADYLNRALITTTCQLTLDLPASNAGDILGDGVYDLPVSILNGDMPSVIKLPYEPIQAINSVKLYDTANNETTYSSSNYYLNTGRLILNEGASWGVVFRPYAAIIINYDAGYGDNADDVPQAIRNAMLMYIQYMYDQRLICEMPEFCMNLLNSYKIYAGS